MPSHTGLWSSYALAGALATAVAVVNYKKPLLKQGTSTVVTCEKNVVREGAAQEAHITRRKQNAPEENWREKYDKAQKEIACMKERAEAWRGKYEKAQKEIAYMKERAEAKLCKTLQLFRVDEALTDILMEVMMVPADENLKINVRDIHDEEEDSIRKRHRAAQHLRVGKMIEFLQQEENAKKWQGLLDRLSTLNDTLKPPPMSHDEMLATVSALKAQVERLQSHDTEALRTFDQSSTRQSKR